MKWDVDKRLEQTNRACRKALRRMRGVVRDEALSDMECAEEIAWILEELKRETRTIIVYEAPHHLVKTLKDLYQALGNRRITVCRELTKKHETAFRTTFEQALSAYEVEEPRGECVIVIEGISVRELEEEKIRSWEEMSLEDHLEYYMKGGMDKKEAMKAVAKDRGVSRREIYQQTLK